MFFLIILIGVVLGSLGKKIILVKGNVFYFFLVLKFLMVRLELVVLFLNCGSLRLLIVIDNNSRILRL